MDSAIVESSKLSKEDLKLMTQQDLIEGLLF